MSVNANKLSWPSRVDVAVVGGGFAGLSTAHELQKAGLKCVVLEAFSRIGGKSFTKPLQCGRGQVEMGCTWINGTTQKRMWALTQKYNIQVAEQYVSGSEIYQDEQGQIHRAVVGEIPTTLNTDEIDQYEDLVKLIDQECMKLNPSTPGVPLPGAAPLAFEDTTFEEWLQAQGAKGFAYFMMVFVCAGILGVEPRDCGLYFLLEMVRSCGDWHSLTTDLPPNGGQNYKIKTGTSSIAHAIAGSLKQDTIFVNAAVEQITQYDRSCVVTTYDGRSVLCTKVVVTVPTNQYHKIAFQPPLPEMKRRFITQCRDNAYCKVILTYRKPWWRDLGFVGKFSSKKGPINFSWDICDPDTNQYSVATFAVADCGAEWSKLNRLQREQAMLDHLAEMVGKENSALVYDILEYNEQDWGNAEWIGGACYPALGGGSYEHMLPILRQPYNHVHFAGTETGGNWRGYMEGAVESGERAAAEVISALPVLVDGSAFLAKL